MNNTKIQELNDIINDLNNKTKTIQLWNLRHSKDYQTQK